MNCFKCGSRLGERDICPKCSADNSMYRKIIHTSNRYYNAGLMKVKARNLSGAVDSLRFCLQMNKTNIQARNLLGLVYYEMGDADLAVREWSISRTMMPKNNPAERYIQDLIEDSDKTNHYNNAVRMFNQSLECIKGGAEDIAIAKLKKVISINPGFLKAYQLIALLYMKREEYEKAETVLNRCLEADQGNIVALTYLSELNRAAKQKKKKKVGVAGKQEYSPGTSFLPARDFSPYLLSAIYILLGCVLAFGVLWYVVTPSIEDKAARKQEEEIAKYQNTIAQMSQQMDEKQSDINQLQEEIDQLKEEQENFTREEENFEGKEEIIAAYDGLIAYMKYYLDEDYIKAATEFESLNGRAVMEGDYYTVYKELRDYRRSTLIAKLVGTGTTLYNQGSYEEALANFQAACGVRADDPCPAFWMAECYRMLGRSNEAIAQYTMILTQFVESNYFEISAEMLAGMTGNSKEALIQQYQELWLQNHPDDPQGDPADQPQDNPEDVQQP